LGTDKVRHCGFMINDCGHLRLYLDLRWPGTLIMNNLPAAHRRGRGNGAADPDGHRAKLP
jgi:hypothetical protein